MLRTHKIKIILNSYVHWDYCIGKSIRTSFNKGSIRYISFSDKTWSVITDGFVPDVPYNSDLTVFKELGIL